jgi:putative SOS response-associated peptidase YedK
MSKEHGAQPQKPQLVYRRHPETGKAVEGYLRWGFIPHDAVTRPKVQPIHARAETITEKSIFADSYRKRRCIVPMNSFFQKDAHGRRFTIARRDGALFGCAGVWDNWRNDHGEWERTFAIITVEACEIIKPVHDRMLAILNQADFPRWLGTEDDPRDLLRPYPSELLDVSLAKAARATK